MGYKPLGMFFKQTDELKKLISEHPDYPIVVLCSSDVVADDDYSWWYAPELKFDVGELLDCEQNVDTERVYTDRDEFEDDLTNMLADEEEYANISDEEFEAVVKKALEEYEPYWKPVIRILADVV